MAYIPGIKITIINTSGTAQTFLGTLGYSAASMGLSTLMKTFATSLTGNGGYAGLGVSFISGGSTPTADDYITDGTFISGLTVNAEVQSAGNSDGHTFTARYSITNNNANAVTIDEVCLISGVPGDGRYWYVLTDRTRLDVPLTIPAGGIGQVSYTINVEFPIS